MYFRAHKNKKYILDEQNVEKYHRDLIGKNLNFENHAKNNLLEYIP